jgi:ribosomal RNA-processing protein 9
VDEFDAEEIDQDIIAQRLQEDVAESKGRVFKHIGAKLSLSTIGKPIPHHHPVTCIAQHGTHVYTGSKGGIIEKWSIEKKPEKLAHIDRLRNKKDFSRHLDDILSLAISGDGKFLATGGQDKRICIWNTTTMTHLKTFTQHRGPVMVTPLPSKPHFLSTR